MLTFGDPYFSFQKQILFTIIGSTPTKNEQKNQCGKLKRIQDFCPRGIESFHLGAAWRAKQWSLNANVFFKEPYQLTNSLNMSTSTIFSREHFTSKI